MPGDPTTKHGLPTMDGAVDLGESIDDTFNAAMTELDALIATAITTDPRPSAGKFGRFHRAASGAITFDTGSTWVEIARAPHAARHGSAGDDPLTVTTAMLAAEVPVVQVGMAVPWTGSGDPPGGRFLLADGRLLDSDDYAALDALIGSGGGHSFNGGVDPGGGQFRLPDFRGRAPVGSDNMGTAAGAAGRLPNSNRARGQNGGAERHTLTTGELASHTHPDNIAYSGAIITPPTHVVAMAGGVLNTTNQVVGGSARYPHSTAEDWTGTQGSHSHTKSGGVQAAGGGGAHNNMQPYLVVEWAIRVL
jgi:microcystin-dependent protein